MLVDITESDLAERIASWEDSLPAHLHLAYLPQAGYIRLRIDGMGRDRGALCRELDEAVEWLCRNLNVHVLATEDSTPEQLLTGELKRLGRTFATAESCTGGNIAHRMTMLAGVSEVFQGGVVSYSNEVKAGVLGVDRSVIEANGAVSEQVASQMASGACRKLGADCAVATSGIAGPSGGSADKPVGMVCMAFAMPEGVHTETFRFPGDRGRVIDRASTMALIRMVQWLRKESVR